MVDQPAVCPKCQSRAEEVKSITVRHLVNEELRILVEDKKYYICLDEDCDIVYFSADMKDIFINADLNTPVWYKKDAAPKYICYCNYVTEDQIIDAVLNHGAKTIRDIVRITGAMKSCNCEINNPLGKCCMPYIQAAIDKAQKLK